MTLKEFLEEYVEPHCTIWVSIINNKGLFDSTCIQCVAAKNVTNGLIGGMHLDKKVDLIRPGSHCDLIIYIKGE